MSEKRAVWNVVALIATLGLAATVAVVAATRAQEKAPEPARSAAPSPSPSPARTSSPGTLDGDGPYVVYATRGGVLAFDIVSGSTVALGALDGTPVAVSSHQPGRGSLIAFPTADGVVWTIARGGMKRVGVIQGSEVDGAVIAPDDRRLAVAALSPKPATVIVDLNTGKATTIERKRGSQYPDAPLLPVAWNLGGEVLYQVPYCQCDDAIAGMYALDTQARTSTLVTGTRTVPMLDFVISASGQALVYGDATSSRRCQDEPSPCRVAPYFLRKLAAGQRGSETLRRADDASFSPDALSSDGTTMLVTRGSREGKETRVERYDADGNRLAPIRGFPAEAVPVALLDDDVVIATTSFSIVVVRAGKAETIARSDPQGDDAPVFLGWLR